MRLLSITIVAGLLLAAPGAGADSYETGEAYDEYHEDDLTPRDELGYRKGKRLKIKVVRIGWADVEVNTAQGFLAMREAAAAEGIQLWIYSGFRSHERQKLLHQAWREGWGNKAARPGHSNHQSGRALDIYLGEGEEVAVISAWLEANAKKFGFRRTVRGEPWHWEYTKPKKKKAKKARKRAK